MGTVRRTGDSSAPRLAGATQRASTRRTADIVDVAPLTAVGARVESSPIASAPTIAIERLILHHLDNRMPEPLLVDVEVALDHAVHELFARYIAQAQQNADWQARFLVEQPLEPAMPDLCARLVRESAAFVEVSQEMARRLFAQMRQRPNQINSGDFVVAIYTAPGSSSACIALFKLDPDERLVRNFSTERGRRMVRISLAGNLMPETVRQKQKCALITPTDDGADFSVALLDTLANIRSEGVAVFFYRGFLATQILPSARRRTRQFLRATDDWLANHNAELSPRALLQVYEARRAALAGDLLDLPDFALAALPERGDLAADLLASITQTIFDAEFEPHQTRFTVDRATADPVVNYVTLDLDGGARLSIPAERFAAMARIDGQRVGGKIRLTIETLTLKEGAPR